MITEKEAKKIIFQLIDNLENKMLPGLEWEELSGDKIDSRQVVRDIIYFIKDKIHLIQYMGWEECKHLSDEEYERTIDTINEVGRENARDCSVSLRSIVEFLSQYRITREFKELEIKIRNIYDEIFDLFLNIIFDNILPKGVK